MVKYRRVKVNLWLFSTIAVLMGTLFVYSFLNIDSVWLSLTIIAIVFIFLVREFSHLIENNDLAFNVLENLTDTILIFDKNGKILKCNSAAEEMLNTRRKHIIGSNVSRFLSPGDNGKANEIIFAPLDKKVFVSLHGVRYSGDRFPAEIHVRKLTNSRNYVLNLRDTSHREDANRELAATTHLLNNIIDNIPNMIFLKKADDLSFELINNAGEKLLGLDRSEIIGKTDYDFFPKHQADYFTEKDRATLRSHDITLIPEEDLDTPAGTRKLYTKKIALRNERGEVIHLLGISEDITEKIRAQNEIKNQSLIIDQIHDSVVSTDMEGNITAWNRGAERIFGYRSCEIIGKHISIVYFEEDWDNLQKNIIEPLKKNGEVEVEVRMRRKSGEEFFAHLSCALLYDAEGVNIGMIGYSMDITERKLAEDALRESENLLKKAQHVAHMGYLDWEPPTGAIKWSEETYNIFGMPLDFEPGVESTVALVHPDDVELVQAALTDTVEKQKPYEIEHRMIRPDGKVVYVHAKGELSIDEHGTVTRMLGTIVDITRLKEIENELRTYQNTLEEKIREGTDELVRAQDELIRKERLATLGQITATISHELRNPLAAIRPSLYVVEKLIDKSDQRLYKAVMRIDRNISRCDNIIDELLNYTRIRYFKKTPTKLDDWLKIVMQEQVMPEGVRLREDYGLGDSLVEFDGNSLRRAVLNIVENAYQSMQDCSPNTEPVVKIQTRREQGKVVLSVIDSGIGMDDEVLAKVFEPLYSTKGFGVGLGMPAVKQIMDQHQGGIEINSKPNQGTKVELWLPYKVSNSE